MMAPDGAKIKQLQGQRAAHDGLARGTVIRQRRGPLLATTERSGPRMRESSRRSAAGSRATRWRGSRNRSGGHWPADARAPSARPSSPTCKGRSVRSVRSPRRASTCGHRAGTASSCDAHATVLGAAVEHHVDLHLAPGALERAHHLVLRHQQPALVLLRGHRHEVGEEQRSPQSVSKLGLRARWSPRRSAWRSDSVRVGSSRQRPPLAGREARANRDGLSNRGQQSQSIEPRRETSAALRPSPITA